MHLRMLGFWLSADSSTPIVADYMIDPSASDEILAVKMTVDGQIVSVEWES